MIVKYLIYGCFTLLIICILLGGYINWKMDKAKLDAMFEKWRRGKTL